MQKFYGENYILNILMDCNALKNERMSFIINTDNLSDLSDVWMKMLNYPDFSSIKNSKILIKSYSYIKFMFIILFIYPLNFHFVLIKRSVYLAYQWSK